MTNDLRREQLQLLKFEKAVAALGAAAAVLPGVAAAANAKSDAPAVSPEVIDAWRQAYLDLAHKTQEIHSAFETSALNEGMTLIGQASGGTGKPPEIGYLGKVLSTLGLS